MSQPTFYKMRGQGGKKVHMGLLIVIVLVGLVAQFRWMQRMKQGESGDVAPNILLEKFGLWFSGKLGGAGGAGSDVSGVKQVTCNNCSGTGSLLSWSGEREICPICQGVGFRMVRQFDAADRLCPACAGMGRVDLMDGSGVATCLRCEGRGMIQSQAAAAAEQE